MKIILQMYINENLGDDLFIDIIANKYHKNIVNPDKPSKQA